LDTKLDGLGGTIGDHLRGLSIFLNGRLSEPIPPLRVGKISSLPSLWFNSLFLKGLRGTVCATVSYQYRHRCRLSFFRDVVEIKCKSITPKEMCQIYSLILETVSKKVLDRQRLIYYVKYDNRRFIFDSVTFEAL